MRAILVWNLATSEDSQNGRGGRWARRIFALEFPIEPNANYDNSIDTITLHRIRNNTYS